jgi:hypothetical protein
VGEPLADIAWFSSSEKRGTARVADAGLPLGVAMVAVMEVVVVAVLVLVGAMVFVVVMGIVLNRCRVAAGSMSVSPKPSENRGMSPLIGQPSEKGDIEYKLHQTIFEIKTEKLYFLSYDYRPRHWSSGTQSSPGYRT